MGVISATVIGTYEVFAALVGFVPPLVFTIVWTLLFTIIGTLLYAIAPLIISLWCWTIVLWATDEIKAFHSLMSLLGINFDKQADEDEVWTRVQVSCFLLRPVAQLSWPVITLQDPGLIPRAEARRTTTLLLACCGQSGSQF